MILRFDSACLACPAKLPAGSEAEALLVGRRWNFLCPVCQAKVARPDRTPQQTLLAILAWWESPCLGERQAALRAALGPADFHDLRVLDLLEPRFTLVERVGILLDGALARLPL